MPSPTTIIQITDTHIFDDAKGELSGINTRQSLSLVLEKIASDYSHADLLVLTGDNTHESGETAYLALRKMLENIPIPYSFLPGNHDVGEMIGCLVAEDQGMDKWLSAGAWNILLLDSHIEGEVSGLLSEDELSFADQMLGMSSNPVLVFAHHPLLPVGCEWLDKQKIANADAFFDIANKHGNVKTIINGHVHQEWQGEQSGIQLFSTPSTCMQFKTNSDLYAEEDLPPGFRWIELHKDGSLKTGVVRI